MRFLGNIMAKVDAKGRVFLPSAFRKILQMNDEENLILRKDAFVSCLTIYPESVWNKHLDVLRARLSRWDAQEQQIFRQFVSDAELLTLDNNGRFLIPKRYLNMANIQQNVKFIGMDDTIEIWCSEATEKPFMGSEEFGAALENMMNTAKDINKEA